MIAPEETPPLSAAKLRRSPISDRYITRCVDAEDDLEAILEMHSHETLSCYVTR
eukprot:m.62295 g.62295  ORF g.62295 m.62295 type:complete len:54 (+) comp35052_c0_seq4:162-323(+)